MIIGGVAVIDNVIVTPLIEVDGTEGRTTCIIASCDDIVRAVFDVSNN